MFFCFCFCVSSTGHGCGWRVWMFRCLRLHFHFHSCLLSSRSQWPFTSKHHFSFPRGAPSQDHRAALWSSQRPQSLSGGQVCLSLARFLQISYFPLRNARLPRQKGWWTVRQNWFFPSNKPNQSCLALHHSLGEKISPNIWSLFNIIHVFIDSPWGPTIVIVKAFCTQNNHTFIE